MMKLLVTSRVGKEKSHLKEHMRGMFGKGGSRQMKKKEEPLSSFYLYERKIEGSKEKDPKGQSNSSSRQHPAKGGNHGNDRIILVQRQSSRICH